MSTAKAAAKFLAFALWSLAVVPPQMILLAVHKGDGAYVIPKLWHKGVCAIFNITHEIKGQPHTNGQTLFMSNHLSYLDIPLLGSILTASFVAKSEVSGWPVFGFLSKLQQTEFIIRKVKRTKEATEKIGKTVASGRSLILFPEGTSTDGRTVHDFKPSLFSLAFAENNPTLVVQPVTLQVLSANGKKPETQDERDIYAWHIDMDESIGVPDHLWAFAKTSGANIKITFHESLKPTEFSDRKDLAKACHDRVLTGLELL